MKALLDTHTFLWWVTDSPQLSERVRAMMAEGANEFFLSAASGWEIVIKAQLGKLELPTFPERFIVEQVEINRFSSLPIRLDHALRVYALPHHHRDPFGRILVAQAQVEGLPILSADSQIARYPVEVIW